MTRPRCPALEALAAGRGENFGTPSVSPGTWFGRTFRRGTRRVEPSPRPRPRPTSPAHRRGRHRSATSTAYSRPPCVADGQAGEAALHEHVGLTLLTPSTDRGAADDRPSRTSLRHPRQRLPEGAKDLILVLLLLPRRFRRHCPRMVAWDPMLRLPIWASYREVGGRSRGWARRLCDLAVAQVAGRRRPAERLEPVLDALVRDAELDVDRIAAGQRGVAGLVHVEHAQNVVVLEELEQGA